MNTTGPAFERGRSCFGRCPFSITQPATLDLCTAVHTLDYEWDQNKAEANLAKHGVDFADAATVFQDKRAIVNSDPDADEERYLITGFDAAARLLMVVFTWRGPNLIRLISARRATRIEARMYSEEQG